MKFIELAGELIQVSNICSISWHKNDGVLTNRLSIITVDGKAHDKYYQWEKELNEDVKRLRTELRVVNNVNTDNEFEIKETVKDGMPKEEGWYIVWLANAKSWDEPIEGRKKEDDWIIYNVRYDGNIFLAPEGEYIGSSHSFTSEVLFYMKEAELKRLLAKRLKP